MTSKVEIKVEGLEGLAQTFRQIAELTAKSSKNWDNYETIILSMLKQLPLKK